MKLDLHCHSYYSDGKHAPDFLLDLAHQNQVTHLAITDHDCITTVKPEGNPYQELTLIAGVEISCEWENQEIHLLGLGFDTENLKLNDLLREQQSKRRQRVAAMHSLLQEQGDHNLLGYMESLPCIAYTRSHVADFLINEGLCKSRQKAFKTHLGKRGRLYVKSQWCPLIEAVSAINEAGGISVLAHPGRYPLGRSRLERLVEDFSSAGGEALEASYSNIDDKTKKQLGEMAAANSLYCSMGSDFHDQAAHWTTLGKTPSLDQSSIKNAIWNHPRWHF